MPLHYLEDWLLCLGGALDVKGNQLQFALHGPISLASYDKRFISSVTATIQSGNGLTDRQILLAVKIVTKYEKQWATLGVSPAYLLNSDIPLRLPIREVDRSCSITLDNKTINVVFPYQSELIAEFHNLAEGSAGQWQFVKEGKQKFWQIDFTEGNIHKLAHMQHLTKVEFSVDPAIQTLMEQAKQPVVPTIDFVDGQMSLVNVPLPAREAMINNGWSPTADLFEWTLAANRYAIATSPALCAQVPLAAKIIEADVDINIKYPGTSTITWEDFDQLFNSNSFSYLFYYRRRELDKLKEFVLPKYENSNRLLFLESNVNSKDSRLTTSQAILEETAKININLQKTILVTDMIIGAQFSRDFLSSQCLGMLYMIFDPTHQ